MANPEENKGAFYQYYWIKVSTEQQLARFRTQMLQPGGAASLSGNDPNYPIHPPLKRYKAVESADHVLTIQTADQALWANVLLSVGCRTA